MKLSSWVILVVVTLAATAACRGRSSVERAPDDESADAGTDAGGTASTGGASGAGLGGVGQAGNSRGGVGTAGIGGTRGGQGGTAGATEECTCDSGDFSCTRSPDDFCYGPGGCPPTLDDTLANLDTICARDGHLGRYSECAGGYVEVSWLEGYENSYRLVFDLATGELVGGLASGYVGGPPGCISGHGSVRAGTVAAGCSESCSFCNVDGGLGGEGGSGGDGGLPVCDDL